jgi:roadblock/LC7 domain-containing protein
MGIAGFTGTRGSAVDAFIDSHKIDAKKLFNFVKKGNLKDRMAFVSAIAGKPNNKMFKMITKQFSESTPQGYNPMVEDKSEITKLVKKVNNSETKFYDVLSVMEKKYGKNKYRIWLEKSLKDFGVNPKHYDYRTNAAVEEKLFQLGK